MNAYRVIVVDDDPETLRAAQFEANSLDNVEIEVHDTFESAKRNLQEKFFHLALIDLEFRSQMDGPKLFRYLSEERPSCEAVLMTSHLDNSRELAKLLDPLSRQATAAISKHNGPQRQHLIAMRSKKWTANRVDVDPCAVIFEELATRRTFTAKGRARPSVEEVDYLLSKVLGQGVFVSKTSKYDIKRAHFELMKGGLSSSVVVKCQPETDRSKGIWIVVKIGPRADILPEYERYCRFVKFLLSLEARVELLGFESGDTLGAVCYSFAGKSPDSVTSLGELLQLEDQRVFQVLDNLFKPESQCWYHESGDLISPQSYMHETHHYDGADVVNLAKETLFDAVNRAQASVVSHSDNEARIQVGQEFIDSVGKVLSAGMFQKPLKTCIVHGDLNPSNVIVAQDNRVMMIDYRHTDFAFRALDFAALECNLRLGCKAPAYLDSVDAMPWDREVWRSAWKGGDLHSAAPFWAKVSLALVRYAQANFPDLTLQEYALTCVVWGVRVAKLGKVTHQVRFRILAWLTTLQNELGL